MIVALVPARDAAGTIGATVAALAATAGVHEVVVVDDGSTDATGAEAAAAGARVVRLAVNRGKGGAVAAGVAATPDAEVYLLVDADVGATAAAAAPLLAPVVEDRADLAVGVLPSAGRRAGFGTVRRLARAGIVRGTGGAVDPRAPLSGQRAVRAELLRRLDLAEGFGLEAAMTVDAARSGARVVEVDVAMDHRHTGRSLAGFRHRARQGVHLVRALWPRLTTARQRIGAIVAAFTVVLGAMAWSGSRWEPSSVVPTGRPSKVVLFGVPRLGWQDVGTGAMPNLDRMIDAGAVAAMSVRTVSGRPSTVEGYATLGAGARVRSDLNGADAHDADAPLEGGTAAEVLARRSGEAPPGQVVVVGAPAIRKLNEGRYLPSLPGALGDALARGVRRTAVIGGADVPRNLVHRPARLRPAPVALMTSGGSVDAGTVGGAVVEPDPAAPFGVRADADGVLAEFEAALASADVVLVDPGDLDRVAEFAPLATSEASAGQRRAALRATDDLLGRVAQAAGPQALVLVVSVVPPMDEWHLTPVVASGAGVVPGYLHSLSSRRLGVVTLTDVAPTVLDALDVPVPAGMIGRPLRYHPGRADLGHLRQLDRDAAFRESVYLRLTTGYIAVQALVYLLAVIAFARLGGAGRAGRPLRLVVLAVSAWPLATFVLRALPGVAVLGQGAIAVLLAIDAAIVAVAVRFDRRPLAPLAVIAGATVALLVADVATGARLQASSLLGYSLHTAARFTGFGNTAFAVLGSTAVLAAALHVHHAPRRREAVVTAAGLLAVVAFADGAPSLGSDVGGILTLVPVFGLTLLALAGRRISWRTVAAMALGTVMVLGVVTGIDLLRPAGSRTHLGRLAGQVLQQGWEPLTTTISRKAAVNVRTYRSPWAWTVPIIAAYMLYVLVWARGWSRLLPAGSALRTAVVGILATGLLGYAVNDSGIVVTALVFVYIGPFLTLLALSREREDQLLPLPPVPGPAPAVALAARAQSRSAG